MFVSASYNYFNGDEHLLASLCALRGGVEHVSLVWQEVSNAGEPITATARAALQEARARGLVDQVIAYAPDLTRPRGANERAKRRLGLEAARAAGASHFLSMDADEFYRVAELAEARRQIAANGRRSTSVDTFLHLRRPVWRAPDSTRCCFLTEISPDTQIGVDDFPSPWVDPTRRMSADPEHHHHFDASTVAMYHMNLVRRDLDQKLRNSTTTDTAFLDEVARVVAAWTPGEVLAFPRKGDIVPGPVRNEFETWDPEEGSGGGPRPTQGTFP
ncbi:hypothetical protein LA6_006163 (plasmid) [Marinibacterium anthonyi]|nr:hypothetical protein LA6_006163 [Marinibacterium anthonyi]